MIRYDLICSSGHEFDGWYRDSSAFDKIAASGHLECPSCGSSEVIKQLMTPKVPAKSSSKTAPDNQVVFAGPQDSKQRALTQAMRELRQHVEKNADYVGEQFPQEARKMHYGEADERGIYGEASLEEAKELHEEGIAVSPLPKLPEDSN